MVFNFYINQGSEPKHSEELEEILKKMENHFADWEDFYTFYSKRAGIPEKMKEQIRQLYIDLREDFISIIKQYNKNIRHFADIHSSNNPDTDFENEVINQMKEMANNFNKKDTDNSFNMYN
jgi:hypothetical protein|tara:strand:- start:190 stop:552 length:363 start_codon:yes stop_codon:yes gene_type:complete